MPSLLLSSETLSHLSFSIFRDYILKYIRIFVIVNTVFRFFEILY
nr:MAG TPA: hypothetical protein [Caudoviricetes sp.]